MINQEKVRTMTKLAIYEDGEGKEDLKTNKFYKFDYIRLQIIKAFTCSSLGFLLLGVLTALYNMEYLILNLTQLNFTLLGKYVLLIYIMVVLFYIIIAATSANFRYKRSKKRLSKYNHLLNKLRKIYNSEDVVKE